MIGINRRRLAELPDDILRKQCRKLSKEWEQQGRPDLDDMGPGMQARYIALRAELDRRGQQLSLF